MLIIRGDGLDRVCPTSLLYSPEGAFGGRRRETGKSGAVYTTIRRTKEEGGEEERMRCLYKIRKREKRKEKRRKKEKEKKKRKGQGKQCWCHHVFFVFGMLHCANRFLSELRIV